MVRASVTHQSSTISFNPACAPVWVVWRMSSWCWYFKVRFLFGGIIFGLIVLRFDFKVGRRHCAFWGHAGSFHCGSVLSPSAPLVCYYVIWGNGLRRCLLCGCWTKALISWSRPFMYNCDKFCSCFFTEFLLSCVCHPFLFGRVTLSRGQMSTLGACFLRLCYFIFHSLQTRYRFGCVNQ